jgi:tRNA pseudouridine38-40 synthase
MPSRNLKLTIAYDGTDFYGWQVQRTGRTVQGVIQDALLRMHGVPVTIYAAGRTDSGVHADGQVINFRTTIDSIPDDEYHVALNANLPRDVRAISSMEVPESFHARYSATRRVYRYFSTFSNVIHPRDRTFAVRLRHHPNVQRLNRLAAPLVGTHDFTTFTLPRDTSRSKVREIFNAGFYPTGGQLVFEISATGFLWRMVRSIVGTLLELDRKGVDPSEMVRRLAARNRTEVGPCAPSQGLVLHYVEYPDEQLHERSDPEDMART